MSVSPLAFESRLAGRAPSVCLTPSLRDLKARVDRRRAGNRRLSASCDAFCSVNPLYFNNTGLAISRYSERLAAASTLDPGQKNVYLKQRAGRVLLSDRSWALLIKRLLRPNPWTE
jgi:hypothetical protein